MTKQVDFYLIPEDSITAKWRFACRLLEKAYGLKEKVYVYVKDAAAAQQIDDLLWTFHDISFIPHAQISANETAALIQIGEKMPENTALPILLNLTETPPAFFDRCDRILEIIPNNETDKNNARKHYQFYKTNGYSIQTHDLRK